MTESRIVQRWKLDQPNGRIPFRDLAELGPPEGLDGDLDAQPRMFPEAAWNYERMRDAAEADGVVLRIVFSYRTFEVQQRKFDDFQNGTGNLAATPGRSNHGWGTALDLNIPDTLAEYTPDDHERVRWLRRNAPERFGFHNDDSDHEPWHWDYEGGFPIGEDEMTEEERAEIDAMRKTIAKHEKLIDALVQGLGSEEQPATFEGAGRRVARSVRTTEETG